MAIFYQTENLPVFKKPVLTIGTFDGVHHGHRMILKEVVREAEKINGESIVLTFHPHPRKLLYPDEPLKLITPLEEKIKLISEQGIHHIIVAQFTKEFSLLPAEEYISRFLVKNFHPAAIVIGYDHHFGHDRSGSISLLKSFEKQFQYKVFEIPAQLIDAAAVSSTKIRQALNQGKVEEAALMLERPFNLKGKVIAGKKLGRELGFPTANLQLLDYDQLMPAHGIYAVKIQRGKQVFKGMLSIGLNPTVSNENKTHIEVNIFDFNETIYGEILEIFFIKWLRKEKKFNSLEELKQQLEIDKAESEKCF